MGDKVDKKGSGSKKEDQEERRRIGIEEGGSGEAKEDQEERRRIRRCEGGSGLKKEGEADRSNKGAAHQSSRLALALATLPF